ncbi:hypothetical protein BHE74_00015766 [Ensete ventricosum]|nr:hypothetical protein BHE74_00015766 [Ensete ventricosum]
MGGISHAMKVPLAWLNSERVHVSSAIGERESTFVTGRLIFNESVNWVVISHLLCTPEITLDDALDKQKRSAYTDVEV